ncbi:hypothetical protein BpHYR1_005547 [Brachionus plicatilis]|uniref:Uncharacterized protein n=1 Tax=Brachionus plicatilis TaxID=10195 RepID=A0A3M7SGF4_BRAPC|nr:hypothetical protein BpHYR1_005547 [Brachionus plicatilis]
MVIKTFGGCKILNLPISNLETNFFISCFFQAKYNKNITEVSNQDTSSIQLHCRLIFFLKSYLMAYKSIKALLNRFG